MIPLFPLCLWSSSWVWMPWSTVLIVRIFSTLISVTATHFSCLLYFSWHFLVWFLTSACKLLQPFQSRYSLVSSDVVITPRGCADVLLSFKPCPSSLLERLFWGPYAQHWPVCMFACLLFHSLLPHIPSIWQMISYCFFVSWFPLVDFYWNSPGEEQ